MWGVVGDGSRVRLSHPLSLTVTQISANFPSLGRCVQDGEDGLARPQNVLGVLSRVVEPERVGTV